MQSFETQEAKIGPWDLQVLLFRGSSRILSLPVHGLIGNAVTMSVGGRHRTVKWKLAVGNAVAEARGPAPWSPRDDYVVTLGFSFHPSSHGNRPLDVDNFLKPTLDALAAGLFSPTGTDLAALSRWGYDDSNFNYFLVDRLSDATSARGEGAALFICSAGTAPA